MSGWGSAIAPLLFKTFIVLIGIGAVGGWYHWKVVRPQSVIAEQKAEIQKLTADNKMLKENNRDKDVAILECRAAIDNTNTVLNRVSSKCTAKFEKLAKALAETEKQPLPAIEGHGPTVMNEWVRRHYSEE